MANLFGRYSEGGGMYIQKIDGNELNLIDKSYVVMGGYDNNLTSVQDDSGVDFSVFPNPACNILKVE